MNSKIALIASKSTSLVPILAAQGYQTILLSDSASLIAVIMAVNPGIVAIDRDILDGREQCLKIGSMASIPHVVTIRDDIQEPFIAGQDRVIHVGGDTTDEVWGQIIHQHAMIEKVPAKTFVSKTKDKILIVDDVEEIVDMYRMMFELKGYEVETAKDGLDGITKAAAFKPKYILLDIMMPHMDGFALMKAFRENTSLKSVIIVNSNLEGSDVADKVYSAGSDYYIRKSDYVPTQIVAMIEQGMFEKKRMD